MVVDSWWCHRNREKKLTGRAIDMRTTRNKLMVATAATALVFGGAGIGVAQASNNHAAAAGKSAAHISATGAAHRAGVAESDKGEDKGEEKGEDKGEGRTGRGANRARSAALLLLPGGKANSVERDNENGATWEVEVTKTDGTTVDVRLDAAYKLVVIESDSEANDAKDDAGDE